MFAPQEESLTRAELDRLQRRRLAELLEVVCRQNPFYRRRLDGVRFDPARDPLDVLPVTMRADLQDDQAAHPPYGSNLSFPIQDYTRLHQTSGSSAAAPLRWLDTRAGWDWWKKCWGVVYAGCGVTPADRIVFPFSFGPFVGFWSAFEAAQMRGNLCLAAGGMTSLARLQYLLTNEATVVCCTPTYALHLAQLARREGLDLPASAVRALIVAGEPGGNVPAVRSAIEQGWGARVFDHAGMTEMGAWGFEPEEAPGGLHVIESEFIAEVRDADGQRVPAGESGELILTNLGRTGSPLIRYRTGDIVRPAAEAVRAGRWFLRLEGGILGRADDMLIVRGNNLFPAALEDVVRAEPGVLEYRYQICRDGPRSDLRLIVEPSEGVDAEELCERIGERIRARFHFRPSVVLAGPDGLERFELKARRRLPDASG